MLKQAIFNAALATTGTVVSMIAGLLVMPHLIAEMGDLTYGFWTLIAGLTAYFGILDFGVTAAVSRLIARSRGRHSAIEINELLSTSIALLSVLGLALVVLTWVASHAFFALFAVPADRLNDVRQAIWVVGLTISATVPLAAFTGLLWSHERFDVINLVDILTAALRTILILLYVGTERPLFRVAIITCLATLIAASAKAALSYVVIPNLGIHIRNVRRATARELFSFGIWMNMLYVSKTLLPQIIPALIARWLSASAVTTYAVARQLVFYTNDFTNAATQVVAPRAAKLNAKGELASQRTLFFEGGRISLALGLFFFGGFLSLGAEFISVWQHGTQNGAYPLLVVLMAGEIIPISQWVTYSQIVGARRQRQLAYLSVVEIVLAAVVCAAVLPRLGLFATCVAVAAVGTLVRGFVQWWLGCQMLEVRLGDYAASVFRPTVGLAAIPIASACMVSHWLQPATWPALLGFGACYAVAYVIVVGVPLLGWPRLQAIVLPARH